MADFLVYTSLMTQIWVNIVWANALLPAGTMLLPEPMLTYHH